MTHTTPIDLSAPHIQESSLTALRARSNWIIAFGAVLAALGALALGSVVTATFVTVYFVGIMMIAAGAAEMFVGFQAKAWGSFFFWIILGVLYAVAGIATLTNPLLAAGLLTLFLGASLIAAGLLRIFLAFQMQAGSSWGWVVVSGAVTALLGVCILAQWPVSSLYTLGVFLSVDLLLAGMGWMSLGMTLSRQKLYS